MAKRQRSNRATPATYLHYGKPDEVVIEHFDTEAEQLAAENALILKKRREQFGGTSHTTDSRTAHDTNIVSKYDKNAALWHPNGCHGRPGVAKIYWRNGLGLCHADYSLKWGVAPEDDDLQEMPPLPKPRRRAEKKSGGFRSGYFGM